MSERRETQEELAKKVARLEERLAEQERRAAEALQEKKQVSLEALAGGVAHDFNNLLAGILGNASLARMKVDETSLPGRALGQIESATQRAATLVRKLLLYSGRAEWMAEQIDATEVITSTLDALERDLDEAVELRREIASGLPTIAGDSSQLATLVVQVFDNAVEAVGNGGGTLTARLELAAAPEPSRETTTYLAENLGEREEWLLFELADTGHGMDAVGRERLFDPFYTTRKGRRGLGLAEVLGITRAHRGWIQVESRPGAGTTLRIGFPV